jgi:transcriptional regulator with XRE-family HTH domain
MARKKESFKAGLGKRLKTWRNSRKLRLGDVSKMIAGTPGPLSEIENDKGLPSIDTIGKLHKNTDLNIMWLIFEEGNMSKKKPRS